MLGTVGVDGKPNDELHGLPFVNESLDGREPALVLLFGNRGQGMGKPEQRFANGNADAPGAEIECENGARSRRNGGYRGHNASGVPDSVGQP